MTDPPPSAPIDPAHVIGVVWLTAHGWPRLDAEAAMLTTPTFRRMGEDMVPIVERLVRTTVDLCRALTDAGLLPPQNGHADA